MSHCTFHPRYKGKHIPKVPCELCWQVYLRNQLKARVSNGNGQVPPMPYVEGIPLLARKIAKAFHKAGFISGRPARNEPLIDLSQGYHG